MQLFSLLLRPFSAPQRVAHRSNVRAQLSVLSLEERVQPSSFPVDLGSAGQFGVLGLRRTDISNQSSAVAGEVGVSQRGSLLHGARSAVAVRVDGFRRGRA